MSTQNDEKRGTSEATEVWNAAIDKAAEVIRSMSAHDRDERATRASYVAHVVALKRGPNSPQARGFRDAEHEEASRAAWGIPDPSDIVTTEPPIEAGWLGAEPVSSDDQATRHRDVAVQEIVAAVEDLPGVHNADAPDFRARIAWIVEAFYARRARVTDYAQEIAAKARREALDEAYEICRAISFRRQSSWAEECVDAIGVLRTVAQKRGDDHG